MILILEPSHCWPSGNLRSPHDLINPSLVAISAALVLLAWPMHTPFRPSPLQDLMSVTGHFWPSVHHVSLNGTISMSHTRPTSLSYELFPPVPRENREIAIAAHRMSQGMMGSFGSILLPIFDC